MFKVTSEIDFRFWDGKDLVPDGGKEYKLERSAVAAARKARKIHNTPIAVINDRTSEIVRIIVVDRAGGVFTISPRYWEETKSRGFSR